MISNWFKYFKKGISRDHSPDPIPFDAKSRTPREILKKLLSFMRPHWHSGILGAILILFSSLLVFPLPLVYRFLVDSVILEKRLDLLPWAILIYGGIKILILGINFLRDYFVNVIEYSIIMDIQTSLLGHTMRLPKAFFDKKEIGYLVSRISGDVQGLRWFFSGTLVYLFTNLIQFIGGLGFLFYLEWRLALVCIIILPILIVTVRYFSKHMRKLSHRGMEQGAVIMKNMQETIATIPLIKAFSTEDQESQHIRDALEDGRQIAMEQNVIGSVANNVINLLPDITKGIVLIAGAFLAIKGDWTLGSLLAFQSYLSYVYSPAIFIANWPERRSAHWKALLQARAIENQLDVFHLPFPHKTTIGRGNRTVADGPIVKIEDGEMGIWVFNRSDNNGTAKKASELNQPLRPPFLHFRRGSV